MRLREQSPKITSSNNGHSFPIDMIDCWRASRRGDLKGLVNLCENNPSLIHCTTMTGWKPIHFAARYNNLNVLEYLIEHGADYDAKTNDGFTALHQAAYLNHEPTISYLANRGAVLDAKNNAGSAPIHLAAAQGNESALFCLIRHGSDPFLANDNGDRAADLANQYGHADLYSYLKDFPGANFGGSDGETNENSNDKNHSEIGLNTLTLKESDELPEEENSDYVGSTDFEDEELQESQSSEIEKFGERREGSNNLEKSAFNRKNRNRPIIIGRRKFSSCLNRFFKFAWGIPRFFLTSLLVILLLRFLISLFE